MVRKYTLFTPITAPIRMTSFTGIMKADAAQTNSSKKIKIQSNKVKQSNLIRPIIPGSHISGRKKIKESNGSIKWQVI